jgi:hypothetical protein
MLRVVCPPGFEPERRYAVDVVLREFLGLEHSFEQAGRDDVELSLHGSALTVPDGLFAVSEEDWLTPGSLPASPDETDDVFGTCFFLLTRYEELVVPDRDEHDRFRASSSTLPLDRPLVNEHVERLWTRLEGTWPRLERRRREFRLLPSHDVDWPWPHRSRFLPVLGDLVRRHDPALAARRLGGANVFDTFDWIMERSEAAGVRSAFYFIAAQTAPEHDGVYSLDDPRIRGLLRRIHERGHEIGLHPSYGTFRDAEQTRRELERLQRVCAAEGIEQDRWGGRQHYLRWENPTTWRNWDEAGLAYDSSLGYSERPGFRCGVCWEFPVFDLQARRPLQLRERPLVVMEQAVLNGLGLSGEAAAAELARLRESCRRHDGDFTLLWHNQRLASRAERRLYAGALGSSSGSVRATTERHE